MGWLSKFFKGSANRVTRGHFNGNFHGGYSAQHTKSYGTPDSDNEDIDHAIALSLSEEDQAKGKAIDTTDDHLEEDEVFARALQESLNDEPPLGQNVPVEDVKSDSTPATSLQPSSGLRVCAECKTPIGLGRFLSSLDSVWHPQCFRCLGCDRSISEYEFAVHEDHPYHRSCYKELFHPKCDVCKNFIQTNKNGLIEYRAHPFWMQKYCPSHDNDGTPRCCSCERMEEFYEGLNMKVEQQIPLLLVERQGLNEAMEAEKMGHHLPETRGLCLSEEQVVRTILKRPIIGPGNKIIDMITGPCKLVRRCEVTAILVIYALPRLLTGSILAHEMMHAYLRLKGYRILSPEVEEGICQVLAHLWLESEITSGSSSNIATTSEAAAAAAAEAAAAVAAAAATSSTSLTSKKGAKTDFEKKLGEFFKHQVETDPSTVYGDGFRAGIRAVERYGLRSTLDHIKLTGSFPC
ncbi:hypothetical protein BRADI_1g14360v3 [Brachypodium distachyon]|uniref:LIM zinc-binding domain-containing protein n=1 Tax=Brachypodium distachyon TaxID=15368 RepID=A0A0Q3GTA2_BRADI|nr:hypothetical protein BRADI_1g14360v3 [Brachypodium distachyon]